jgi:hypothetical protein
MKIYRPLLVNGILIGLMTGFFANATTLVATQDAKIPATETIIQILGRKESSGFNYERCTFEFAAVAFNRFIKKGTKLDVIGAPEISYRDISDEELKNAVSAMGYTASQVSNMTRTQLLEIYRNYPTSIMLTKVKLRSRASNSETLMSCQTRPGEDFDKMMSVVFNPDDPGYNTAPGGFVIDNEF